MNTYVVRYTGTEPDWSAANTLKVNHVYWEPDNGCRMQVKVLWGEAALFVYMKAVEKDIRAEHDTPYGMICEDSCMEFFFRPEENDSRYFNFETNLKGWFYIGVGNGRSDCVRLIPGNQKKMLDVHAHVTDDGWETYYKIPLDFLRVFFPDLCLKRGKKIYANFYKCGDLTVQPHYMAWNPVHSETPDFHRSCDFGLLVLE